MTKEPREMRRLLLLEDEQAQQRLMHDLLTDEGFQVCLAGTPDEARLHMDEHPHQLLIADLQIDGTLVSLADLRGDRDLKILVVSAHDSRIAAAEDAAATVVSKPYDVDELIGVIRRLVA